ncbi:hypothetical protein [Lactococcus lactis]|uniref:hypothetical protein n=1 Tax=Lactococcus lactis TaxID=1358 RepID=UPI00223AA2DA|nr:hypothetical protein [Lactococcus lactis]
MYKEGAVRRIGVSANNLIDEAIQEALDSIRQKYHFVYVQIVLKNGARAVARSKKVGGHSVGGLESLN